MINQAAFFQPKFLSSLLLGGLLGIDPNIIQTQIAVHFVWLLLADMIDMRDEVLTLKVAVVAGGQLMRNSFVAVFRIAIVTSVVKQRHPWSAKTALLLSLAKQQRMANASGSQLTTLTTGCMLKGVKGLYQGGSLFLSSKKTLDVTLRS